MTEAKIRMAKEKKRISRRTTLPTANRLAVRFRLLMLLLMISAGTDILHAAETRKSIDVANNAVGTSKPTTTAPSEFSITLATAVPVIASMITELTENTAVKLVYLPPERYSIKRIPGWLNRQSPTSFPAVDASAGIASVWPSLDIYPALRMRNIRVVPIDAANAYVPGGERVAISRDNGSEEGYFWLNPANALVMLGIINRDLVQLMNSQQSVPNIRSQISRLRQNLQGINTTMRELQVQMDSSLNDLGVMQVAVSSPGLIELAAATVLPAVTLDEAMKNEFPTLMISQRKPGHKSLQDLPEHIKAWNVDDFAKMRKGTFTQRWRSMIARLSVKPSH